MGVEDGEAVGTTVVPTEPSVVGAVGAAVVALV
jgi:hypothetical protein